MAEADTSSPDLGLAFAVTTGAGLASSLGAAMVFFPRIQTGRFLAGSLGFAAGVMLYVSFVEIFVKSLDEFSVHFDAENTENGGRVAYNAATGCFFLGVFATLLLDTVVHRLHQRLGSKKEVVMIEERGDGQTKAATHLEDTSWHEIEVALPPPKEFTVIVQPGHDNADGAEDTFSATLSTSRDMHDDLITSVVTKLGLESPDLWLSSADGKKIEQVGDISHGDVLVLQPDKCATRSETSADVETHDGHGTSPQPPATRAASETTPDPLHTKDKKELLKMAVMAGVAIALHNFPEGLATFVATAYDPKVGAAMAFAIAVHNIPEGLCVAIPHYFSTRNRLKAFFWGTMSGVVEPLAGAVGWIILSHGSGDGGVTPLTYAFLFGLVSGMMVYISLKELIPTAHKYDPNNELTSNCTFMGMAVMAASLMLFQG